MPPSPKQLAKDASEQVKAQREKVIKNLNDMQRIAEEIKPKCVDYCADYHLYWKDTTNQYENQGVNDLLGQLELYTGFVYVNMFSTILGEDLSHGLVTEVDELGSTDSAADRDAAKELCSKLEKRLGELQEHEEYFAEIVELLRDAQKALIRFEDKRNQVSEQLNIEVPEIESNYWPNNEVGLLGSHLATKMGINNSKGQQIEPTDEKAKKDRFYWVFGVTHQFRK